MMFALLVLGGCNSDVPEAVDYSRQPGMSQPECAELNAPLDKPSMDDREFESGTSLEQKADAGLDVVTKHMDDFSAMLGLQYARFSYDTNRYLLDYTNLIAGLDEQELYDFVIDFLRARARGMDSSEATAFRNIIRPRMIEALECADFHLYSTHFSRMADSYRLELNYQGLENETLDCLYRLKQVSPGNNDAILSTLYRAVSNYKSIQMALLDKGDEQCMNLAGILRREIANDDFSDEELKLALAMEAYIFMEQKPEYALQQLRAVHDNWNPSRKGAVFQMTQYSLQALERGLRGKHVHQYTCDQIHKELRRKYGKPVRKQHPIDHKNPQRGAL